jgi:hypothetical protein
LPSNNLPDFLLPAFTQKLTILNSSPVVTDSVGTSGIYFAFTFLPDKTLTEQVTDEELEWEVKMLKNMNVSMVRTFFYPDWAWDAENGKWDWNSEYMTAFYRYCKVMKDNGIDILGCSSGPGDIQNAISNSGLQNPIPVITGSTDFQTNANQYGEWLADFVKETVVKRGYNNIKYFLLSTEPNNRPELWLSFEAFETFLHTAKAVHEGLVNNNLRDKIQLLGPGITTAASAAQQESLKSWTEWTIEYADQYLDIYAIHRYVHLTSSTENSYPARYDWVKSVVQMIKSTGKPLWIDETNSYIYELGLNEKSMNDPLIAMQVALNQVASMNGGASANIFWSLFSQKFTGNLRNTGDRVLGVQMTGMVPYFRFSRIPTPSYYVMGMMGRAFKKDASIYEGVSDDAGIYTTMSKNGDGSYGVMVVNTLMEPVEIDISFEKAIDKASFKRYMFSPLTHVSNSSATPIAFDKTITNAKNGFKDVIAPYAVVVYTAG